MYVYCFIGCSAVINSRLSDRKLEDYLTFLGSNIFAQSNDRFVKQHITPDVIDLFLEQILVCKWSGIKECYSKSKHQFLLTLLDKKTGCVKDPDHEPEEK